LVTGPVSFFFQPGEALRGEIKKIYILAEDEALLLRAEEGHTEELEGKKIERNAGDKWMVHGPRRYIPAVEVTLIEKRNRIPLDKNDGIYVRDTKEGSVRSVQGESYMLKAHEETWEMELDPEVERLLGFSDQNKRDKKKQVSLNCAYNSAV
jgi:major vault protein